MRSRYLFPILLLTISLIVPVCLSAQENGDLSELVRRSSVQGGVIVHAGCGDAEETAALRINERFLVQGLVEDPELVSQMREELAENDSSGAITILQWDGTHLPYADHLVNLLIVERPTDLGQKEIMRVLVPNGVVWLKEDGTWKKQVKSWPEDIDEWRHYLHGSDNNAVAEDTRVAPPHHMQWVSGPRWARSHDHLASLSAAVSANGRLFYIVDEAPAATVHAPSQWMLVARDAFNGVLLWKKEVTPWEDRFRPFRSGPTELPRRLVAYGDEVYVTLGYGKPVTALDAATGDVLRTYEDTENTHEILYHEGDLYLVVSDPLEKDDGTSGELLRRLSPWTGRAVYRQYAVKYPERRIRVVRARDGKTIWEKKDSDTQHLQPTALAVDDGRVFFQNEKDLIALNARTGEELWRADRPMALHRPGFSAPTLVVKDGVVLSADRSPNYIADTAGENKDDVEWLVSPTMISKGGELLAFSAEDGEPLWTAPCKEAFNSPVDVFVVDGKVWSGFTVSKGRDEGITKVYDLQTGEVSETRPPDSEVFSVGFVHGRCYRNKATTEYILHGRAGVEFVDVDSNDINAHHWIRGTCQYGILACNGLLYVPPHSCACYNEAKLDSLNALAPKRPARRSSGPRLVRGPAYDSDASSPTYKAGDWPTYRHDGARSGVAGVSLPSDVTHRWSKAIPGPLTGVVITQDRLYVAQKDAGVVHALSAKDGAEQWRFAAGARVDSPPTACGDYVYFGSADGWGYCVSADDGELAWRFRAAPEESQVVAYGRIESAWPVSGSVLVDDGIVYAVAGRSSFLDGGLYLYGLDAVTGELEFEERISHRDPETGREPQETITGKRGTYMPGALPDILSTDGSSIFMRHSRFNLEGESRPPEVDHLFSPAGFLDDDWWHRTYWLVGTEMLPDYHGWPVMGCERITGRLLVHAGEHVYGFAREDYTKAGSHLGLNADYHLFSAESELEPPGKPLPKDNAWWKVFPESRVNRSWSTKLPFLARGMILSGDTLFVAGTENVVDFNAAKPQGKVWLWAVSTQDGTKQAGHPIEAAPVFDSLAASSEGLFFTTVDGRVHCWR